MKAKIAMTTDNDASWTVSSMLLPKPMDMTDVEPEYL